MAPSLSPAQIEAAKVWASAYEHLRNPTAPVKRRMWASDIMRQAKAALTLQEIAILDLVAGKGNSPQGLAARTGRSTGDLLGLLGSALTHLAQHLEDQAAKDDAA